jgi:hypothetical protein
MSLFVVDPKIHILFRAVAAFIIAPLLLWRGTVHGDVIVFAIGLITLIVDTFTFYKSVAMA